MFRGCSEAAIFKAQASSGTLAVANGATVTHQANGTASIGALVLSNGTYDYFGGQLSPARGITLNSGTFIWESIPGQIALNGQRMMVNSAGTLSLRQNVDVNSLFAGSYFQGGGSLVFGNGTLWIENGAKATDNGPLAAVVGYLSVRSGTYSLDANGWLGAGGGITVGTDGGLGRFEWHRGSIYVGGHSLAIGANGTLAMGQNFAISDLLSGNLFAYGGGSVDLSQGALEITDSATATQNNSQTVSLGFLLVTNGTYYLDGNGTLSASRGICVGTDGNSGILEWHSGTIGVGGNAMTVEANGTLAMDSNFSVNGLFSGSLFSGGGSLSISSGTLEVENGAAATVASGSAMPRVGTLYLTHGGLSFSSGSSGISVQNALKLDGNSSLQSSDANNIIIIQPALGASAHSSIQILSSDSNALSGLGNVTLKCQFDPNEGDPNMVIELEVAGRAYDPNLVDPNTGNDNNFSKSNFFINHLVVGNDDNDANVGKYGVTLRLVNHYANQSSDPNDDKAVYVGTLEMLRGSTIDTNHFHLYYLTSAGFPNKKKEFFLGDANLDGKVDGVDFLIWQAHYPTTIHSRTWSDADFNGDRTVDGVDFLIWQSHYPSNSLSRQSPSALTNSAGICLAG